MPAATGRYFNARIACLDCMCFCTWLKEGQSDYTAISICLYNNIYLPGSIARIRLTGCGGKMILTSYGKEFFTCSGIEIFTCFGKEILHTSVKRFLHTQVRSFYTFW